MYLYCLTHVNIYLYYLKGSNLKWKLYTETNKANETNETKTFRRQCNCNGNGVP